MSTILLLSGPNLNLLGRPMRAHVVAHHTGHRANRALVKRIANDIGRKVVDTTTVHGAHPTSR